MNLVIGCDDAGLKLKEVLKHHLKERGFEYDDYGVKKDENAHYPTIAINVAEAIVSGKYDRGILICGTGIGVCISANKVKGIRAAQAHDTYSAERAQLSNNAQILCLGARIIGEELAKKIVDTWLNVSFQDSPSTEKIQEITTYDLSR